MKQLLDSMGAWGVPAVIITIVTIVFILMQVIGEIIEFKGKVVPEFMKIRKYFKRKKQEKQERTQLLKTIAEKFSGFEQHYCPENIEKRNRWMDWVEDRAVRYDKAIDELKSVENSVVAATKLSETVYIQNCRAQIIDFSYKVRDIDNRYKISREEFDNIFEIYDDYEEFNRAHNRVNGKTDRAMETIRYYHHEFDIKHYFLEDYAQHQIEESDN